MPRTKLNKRSDGRYSCRYEDKYFYGKTQAQALKKRDEYISALAAGIDKQYEGISFQEYSANWVQVYRSECNPKAKQQYKSNIQYFNDHLTKKNIVSITQTDIQKIFNTLQGKSKSHIHKFTMTIRGIFRSALSDGAILKDPMEKVKPPKGTEGQHRCLEQWQKDLVLTTYKGHDFGLCALTMMLAGLRRGEVLYIDVDRDADFVHKTLTVRGAVSFCNGNQPTISDGKTEAAQRTIPMSNILANALKDHHGLLCTNENGGLMSETAFTRKYESYMSYLAECLNGCTKRWYGRTREHKAMLEAGILPEWKDVSIRSHDFRVTYCTMCYEAGIPIKTLQTWMGHEDATLIMKVYAKLSGEKQQTDLDSLNKYFSKQFAS